MSDSIPKKEKGRIVLSGMGGFLNPPTHPEHTRSVETDLRRRPENRGSMSLSCAVDCKYLDDATRAAARTVLNSWQRPALDSAEVQDWIRQVLGYFRGCYRNPEKPESGQWDASDAIIDSKRDPLANANDHCGVHLIRKYYPEFTPTAEHFSGAYWGKKPE